MGPFLIKRLELGEVGLLFVVLKIICLVFLALRESLLASSQLLIFSSSLLAVLYNFSKQLSVKKILVSSANITDLPQHNALGKSFTNIKNNKCSSGELRVAAAAPPRHAI